MQTGDKVKLVKALSGLPSTTDDATIYFNANNHKIYLGNQSYGDGTTYTFASGTNGFTVTPSNGSAQTVEVTPSLEKSATNSFDDGIDSYFKKVVSSIVPVQAGSGAPSPINERPITGFTECTVNNAGKNLFNNVATTQPSIGGVEFVVNSDKSVNVNTPSAATNTAKLPLGNITLKANMTYILSGCPSGGGRSTYDLYIAGTGPNFDRVTDNGNGVTFTPSEDVTTSVRITVYAGATVSNKVFYPMIRLATETDGTYVPYVAPSTATISFGSAGTVYGGYVGLISGKLVVTRAGVDMGSLTWNYGSTEGHKYFNASVTGIKQGNNYTPSNILCEEYKTESWINVYNNVSDYIIGVGNDYRVYIYDKDYTDATSFKTAMSGVQLVYELDTPQEYQLTPAQLRSLVGANRLTSSTGEVTEVEYITNKTIAYVDDKVENNTFTFKLYGVPSASLTTPNTDITQYSSATVAEIKAAADAGKFIYCEVLEAGTPGYYGLSLEAIPTTTSLVIGLALITGGKRYAIAVDTANSKILSVAWNVNAYPTSIATSYNTNQLTLASNTKYALTAGGSSFVFTTPPYQNSIIATITMFKDQVLSFMGTTFDVGSLCDKTSWQIYNAISSFDNNHKTSNIYIKLYIENDGTEYLLQYVGYLEANDTYYFVYDNFSRTLDDDDDDATLRHIEFALNYSTSARNYVRSLTFRHKPLIASVSDIGMVRINTIRSGLQIDSDGALSAPGADYIHTVSTTSANFVTGADLTSYCSASNTIWPELRGAILASEASTNVRLNIRLDNSRELIAVPFSNFTTNSSGKLAIFKTKTLDIDDNGGRNYKNVIISVSPQSYPNNSKVTLELYEDAVQNNAGFHNSIYRGKFLGTSITAEQYAQISAGTFDDMFIGDYWTISTTFGSTTKNVDYVIAGFDYWWNVGDSYPQSGNKHHIVLVPSTFLYNAQMNSTNATTGGYAGSEMYTTNLADARTGIGNAFSGHLYHVRRLFTSSVGTDGQAATWIWTTSSVDLMSETMVYGTKVWSNSGYEVGNDEGILPLFALNPSSRLTRTGWWLRSVASPSHFALVGGYGDAYYILASVSIGVRPCFAIYGGD